MDRRHFLQLSVSLSIGSGALLTGCGGGGGRSVDTTSTGGVDGFLFQDASGNLILARTRTPPAGTTPVADATVAIVAEGGRQVRTGADGRFALDRIPAGLYTLRLTPPTAAPLDVPVTIVGGASVTLGEPAVSRASALQKAKDALAGAGVLGLGAAAILAPQQPLPTGVLVVPRFQAARIDAAVAGARTLTAPSWFFFVDLAPGQPFAHDVHFVFVDSATGEVQTQRTTSWPTFNAQHFYADAVQNQKIADLIQPGRHIAPPRDTPAKTVPPAVATGRQASTTKLHQLFIYGYTESAPVYNPTQFWGHGGIPVGGGRNERAVWQEIGLGDSLRETAIAAMKRIVDAASPGDTVLLDISTHGGVDSDGRYFMWAPSARRIGLVETAARVFGSGIPVLESEMLRIEDLDLPATRACNLVVLAGTCYSGHWVFYARAALDLQGKTVTVFAACGLNEVSWGALGSGIGVQATRFFRTEIEALPGDAGQPGLLAAAGRAEALTAQYMEAQVKPEHADLQPTAPTRWSRTPATGEDCGISLTPRDSEVGTSQFATLTVSLNNRPSGSPPVRIHLTTTLGELTDGRAVGAAIDLTADGKVSFSSTTAGTATVTAEAFEKVDGKESSIGKATATIEVKLLSVRIDPPTQTIAPGEKATLAAFLENYKPLDATDTIVFEWKATTTAGALQPDPSDTAFFLASTDRAGTDTITASAILVTASGRRVPLAKGTATVTVGRTGTVPVQPTLIFIDDAGANIVLGRGNPVMVWGFTFPITPKATSYAVEFTSPSSPRSAATLKTADLGNAGTYADIWSQPQRLAPLRYTLTTRVDNFVNGGGFFHVGQTIFVPMGFTGYGKDQNYEDRATAEQSIRDIWYTANQHRLAVEATVTI
jgi:hypothetical protein